MAGFKIDPFEKQIVNLIRGMFLVPCFLCTVALALYGENVQVIDWGFLVFGAYSFYACSFFLNAYTELLLFLKQDIYPN